MTAQISDEYIINGVSKSVVAMSEPMCFNPKDYGIIPHSRCTACWRGYWCEYEIQEESLVLKKLFINTENQEYPDFNGVPVSPIEYEQHWVLTFSAADFENMDEDDEDDDKGDYKLENVEAHFGHRKYEVEMKMNYTGKIVLGDRFLDDYYIHMGFQRAWAYEELKEYEFKNGVLVNTVDHSEYAKGLREMIDRDPEGFDEMLHKNIPDFVEDSFSLDLESKAWWI